jgi:hypothetical protein
MSQNIDTPNRRDRTLQARLSGVLRTQEDDSTIVASPFRAVAIVGLGSGLGDSLRIFEAEFFLVPSQMPALPDW